MTQTMNPNGNGDGELDELLELLEMGEDEGDPYTHTTARSLNLRGGAPQSAQGTEALIVRPEPAYSPAPDSHPETDAGVWDADIGKATGVRRFGVDDHGLVAVTSDARDRARAQILEPASSAFMARFYDLERAQKKVKNALQHLDAWEHLQIAKDLALVLDKLRLAYAACSHSVRSTDLLDPALLQALEAIEIPSDEDLTAGIQRALASRGAPDAFEDESPTGLRSDPADGGQAAETVEDWLPDGDDALEGIDSLDLDLTEQAVLSSSAVDTRRAELTAHARTLIQCINALRSRYAGNGTPEQNLEIDAILKTAETKIQELLEKSLRDPVVQEASSDGFNRLFLSFSEVLTRAEQALNRVLAPSGPFSVTAVLTRDLLDVSADLTLLEPKNPVEPKNPARIIDTSGASHLIVAPAQATPTVIVAPQTPHQASKKWYVGEPAIPGLFPLTAGIVAVIGTVAYLQSQKDNPPSPAPIVATAVPMEVPSVPVATPPPSASEASVAVPFTPVYTKVAQAVPEGADRDLRIAVTNQWLNERLTVDAHDWTDVRQTHPWKEDAQALEALRGHLKSWGGYKNPLLAYDSAKARGEAPRSISAFLRLVDEDPQLADGTALRIAREIPLVKDKRINDDEAVLANHDTLNGYVTETVNHVQGSYAEGKLERPAKVEYHREDLPDVSADLEPLEYDGELIPLDELPRDVSSAERLNALADWTASSHVDLLKKARGANRQLLPSFLTQLEEGTRTLSTRLTMASTEAEREALILEQKTAFFAELKTLRKGDGPYHSRYLKTFAEQYLAQLAEALPAVPEEAGIEGVQARTRRELIATLPEGLFRP